LEWTELTVSIAHARLSAHRCLFAPAGDTAGDACVHRRPVRRARRCARGTAVCFAFFARIKPVLVTAAAVIPVGYACLGHDIVIVDSGPLTAAGVTRIERQLALWLKVATLGARELLLIDCAQGVDQERQARRDFGAPRETRIARLTTDV